ncbi:MAG: hypothetical protein ACM3TN_23490 [Alphaproteobacteria bacterium]
MNLKTRMAIGRSLLTAVAVLLPAVTLVVEWTIGHLADPTWHAHARYHLLLYHGTMIMFCSAAVWCLWGHRRTEPFAIRCALFVALAFLIPFYPAALFPTASIYATPDMAEHGVPVNLIIMGALTALALVGYYFAHPPRDAQPLQPTAAGAITSRRG